MPPKQYSKFKPWRKGKSAEKRLGAAAGGKKISLKNRLRGQRRLLAKLTEKGESGDALEGVKGKIAELEKEVRESEAREREKKNATKYHQIKFIERQKVTRLEKSVQRQLKKLKEENTTHNDEAIQEKIAKLQAQLNATAMDQLYIAFFPADVKYMSLFTNGMQRAVDDERGQKRRKNIWNRIRQGLLNDLKNENEDGRAVEEEGAKEKKVQLENAKNWVNLDAAKKALLSIPEDTYPNAPSLLPIVSDQRQQSKAKQAKRESIESKSDANAASSDDRFVFSKELDGLFHESTTGDDYEKEAEVRDAIQKRVDDEGSKDSGVSSDSDDDDSSSEDDADPLKGYAESEVCPSDNRKDPSNDDEDKVEKSTNEKVADEKVSSSSSSSSDDSDSDNSDSDSDAVPSNTKGNADNNFSTQKKEDVVKEDDDDDQDDFFNTEKVSAEEVFAQAQKQQQKERAKDDHYPYQKKRSDKSKGFATQNQTKREFRNFQHRKKRSKFG